MFYHAIRCAAVLGTAAILSGCYQYEGTATASSCDAPRKHLPEFVLGTSPGFSGYNNPGLIAQQGYEWARMELPWKSLQPSLDGKTLYTQAQVEANPDLIREFSENADWTFLDNRLSGYANSNLKIIGMVGNGNTNNVPVLNGKTLYPDLIGRDKYIGMEYLVTRAIVERYDNDGYMDGPAGIEIKLWQTENELNVAGFHTIPGWRGSEKGPGIGTGLFTQSVDWKNFDFLTALLRGLNDAVRDSDNEAVTTTNLNNDLPESFSQYFAPQWPEAVAAWRGIVDVISLDTYPNYFHATPVEGAQVGFDVATAKAHGCPGQDVMIMETGYPRFPSRLGYNEDNQIEFLRQAWETSIDAGVDGFMFFGGGVSAGHNEDAHLNNQLSDNDVENFYAAYDIFDRGRLDSLTYWLVRDHKFITERLANEVSVLVEAGWVTWQSDANGTPQPTRAHTEVMSPILNGTYQFTGRYKAKRIEFTHLGNRCLAAASLNPQSGTNVVSQICNNEPNQHWLIGDDGSVHSAANAALCLDVSGGLEVIGSNIQVYTCNNSNAQRWWNDGSLHSNLGGNWCADIADGSNANGANVRMWPCNGSPAQRVENFPALPALPSFEIRASGNKCLDIDGTSPYNNNQTMTWDCAGVAWQRWQLDDNGWIRNRANPGYCLDFPGNSASAGLRAMTWECSDVTWQKWLRTPEGQLKSQQNQDFCLDFGSASGNGSAVTLQQCNGTATSQQWSFFQF